MPGIYDEPEFYEAACAYREVPAEADALLRWYQRYRSAAPAGDERPSDPPALSGGGLPRSVLELAAGPAEHARELARRGIAVTALDLNPAMCARAKILADAGGYPLTVVEADMRDFSLPGHDVDLAITMLNSLCHLMTLDDMVRHLESVRRHLADGGLYIFELAHPADYFTSERRTSSEWSTDIEGGTVTVRWGGYSDHIDPITQVTREHVSVAYSRPGHRLRTITDVVPNRFWTATEICAAVRLAGGFAITASHGDFEPDTPLDAPDAWRMIFVLTRTSADCDEHAGQQDGHAG